MMAEKTTGAETARQRAIAHIINSDKFFILSEQGVVLGGDQVEGMAMLFAGGAMASDHIEKVLLLAHTIYNLSLFKSEGDFIERGVSLDDGTQQEASEDYALTNQTEG